MPFKSKAQQRLMFARHPRIARRWAHETKSIKTLPNKVASAFDLAFSDEICKIAAGSSRITAVRLARRAAPFAAKKIRGIRRRYSSIRKKVKGAR